ncbi:Hsp33 family molecular chaperone HslO [Aquariibacter albus]|uniref:Hsp33 family molecular chaperone HslO n=1 Tax=Aquariibacter albus TaxID=2759899 RepID=A0A839HPY3_9BURK|nr:Hsp33 family molecular chaperone HslO [Aquariibacter albus]MBB1161081.1 Hsp33 family molecular chaperone HslO [Aquariibacter albus]
MSELHKFIFEGLPVRGMLVRLTEGWQALQARRAAAGGWPAPLTGLVGELAAAGVLMQANLKFNGALVLQIHGDGPVKLAVVEVQPELKFRATATLEGELAPDAGLPAMVNAQGKGRCAITLDPADRLPGQQPYQGVVPLHGDRGEPLHRLSEVLEHYMLQSEQLDTKLILAANGELAAGLLIQRLPVEGEGNLERAAREDAIGLSEAYTRIAHLASTLTPEELLTLDAETVLRRLFWEEDLRRFEPLVGDRAPRFACRCSRERVGAMLRSLGREEMDGLIAERGEAEVGCEFCGAQYRFDAVDVGELFVPQRDQPPVSGRPQ